MIRSNTSLKISIAEKILKQAEDQERIDSRSFY